MNVLIKNLSLIEALNSFNYIEAQKLINEGVPFHYRVLNPIQKEQYNCFNTQEQSAFLHSISDFKKSLNNFINHSEKIHYTESAQIFSLLGIKATQENTSSINYDDIRFFIKLSLVKNNLSLLEHVLWPIYCVMTNYEQSSKFNIIKKQKLSVNIKSDFTLFYANAIQSSNTTSVDWLLKQNQKFNHNIFSSHQIIIACANTTALAQYFSIDQAYTLRKKYLIDNEKNYSIKLKHELKAMVERMGRKHSLINEAVYFEHIISYPEFSRQNIKKYPFDKYYQHLTILLKTIEKAPENFNYTLKQFNFLFQIDLHFLKNAHLLIEKYIHKTDIKKELLEHLKQLQFYKKLDTELAQKLLITITKSNKI